MSVVVRPRAVLWDLDGTLIDSGDYHWRAWRDTMRMEKFDLPYERFLDSFGQKNDRILKGWLGNDTPDERIRTIGDAKEALYREFARREGLMKVSDDAALEAWVDQVLAANPAEAARFKAGEVKLLGVLVGQVMKLSKGAADPRKVNQILTAMARAFHGSPTQ